jgi:hypothetical protein
MTPFGGPLEDGVGYRSHATQRRFCHDKEVQQPGAHSHTPTGECARQSRDNVILRLTRVDSLALPW